MSTPSIISVDKVTMVTSPYIEFKLPVPCSLHYAHAMYL